MRVYECPNLGYDAMNAEEVFCLDCKAYDLWRVGSVSHDFPTSDFLTLLEDGSDIDLRMPQARSEMHSQAMREPSSLWIFLPQVVGYLQGLP